MSIHTEVVPSDGYVETCDKDEQALQRNQNFNKQ